MNLAELSIKKSVITWTLTAVLLFAGLNAFGGLPRLEDPEFTIKEALITTPYPGASAAEVANEVSNVIEMACQEMGQLKRVESTNARGVSIVKAVMKDQYDKATLPQVFDELRRKVTDYQNRLPPGAGPSVVNDDYGDVFGIYVVLTGEGYPHNELYETAKYLRRELLLAQDVKKITLWGVHKEVIFVEMARAKMAALGISQQDIYDALEAKNLPIDAGRTRLGPEYLTINPTGEFTSEQQFGDLLISSRQGGQELIFLRDVATIRRGYQDPPEQIIRAGGQRGVGLGISTRLGGNVVEMGEDIERRLARMMPLIPLGMDINVVSLQSQAVVDAISGFVVNLLEAVIIVIVVLLLFMGLRSALIIGGILFLTIAGTFLFMAMQNVTLERISLGALIIALGMLVDNAIVIVDGMQVRIEQGMDRVKAAAEVVGQNSTPLLGATAVAIMAFAAIGTSDDSTGEYCRSLYTVILISLGLSWVTAVTTTPLVAKVFLKGKSTKEGEEQKDPYGGKFYAGYRGLLSTAIKHRWFTVAFVVAAFALSLFGFGFVKQMFFPNSTRPQFFVEFWLPADTHIEETERVMAEAEEYVLGLEGVTNASSAIGGGDLRFLLTYTPNSGGGSYGVMFVDVEDYKLIEGLEAQVQGALDEMVPEGIINVRKFLLGPGEGGKLQLRISGPDRTEVRRLGEIAKRILHEEGGKAIRDEWREKVKVIRPVLAEAQARRLGITRPRLTDQILSAFEGKPAGIYREGDEFLPILARAPEYERLDLDNIRDLQIWSPAAQQNVPMRQVLDGFETEYEDAQLWRRNRTSTIRVHSDPKAGMLSSELLARAKGRIERELGANLSVYFGKPFGSEEDPYEGHDSSTIKIQDSDQIPLEDPSYFIAWGGEAEEFARAQTALASSIPIFAGLMVLIVIGLFNAVRQPLIIWLTVPLALIGVTAGLLLFRQPFGFMALLGALSLTGMLIKNSIVLIEEIDRQIEEGIERYAAILGAGVSRMRPVIMAAATTILGMIPLLTDAFFVSMAVAIMVGLLVATLLTLVVVPVLYAIFFRIGWKGSEGQATEPAPN